MNNSNYLLLCVTARNQKNQKQKYYKFEFLYFQPIISFVCPIFSLRSNNPQKDWMKNWKLIFMFHRVWIETAILRSFQNIFMGMMENCLQPAKDNVDQRCSCERKRWFPAGGCAAFPREAGADSRRASSSLFSSHCNPTAKKISWDKFGCDRQREAGEVQDWEKDWARVVDKKKRVVRRGRGEEISNVNKKLSIYESNFQFLWEGKWKFIKKGKCKNRFWIPFQRWDSRLNTSMFFR